jgi:hypothetical protein
VRDVLPRPTGLDVEALHEGGSEGDINIHT